MYVQLAVKYLKDDTYGRFCIKADHIGQINQLIINLKDAGFKILGTYPEDEKTWESWLKKEETITKNQ